MRKIWAIVLTVLLVAAPFGTCFLADWKTKRDMAKWPITSALFRSGGENVTYSREYDYIDEHYEEVSRTTSGISYTYWVNGVTYDGGQSWSGGGYWGPHEGVWIAYVDIRHNPRNPAESVYDIYKVAAPIWLIFVGLFIASVLIGAVWHWASYLPRPHIFTWEGFKKFLDGPEIQG